MTKNKKSVKKEQQKKKRKLQRRKEHLAARRELTSEAPAERLAPRTDDMLASFKGPATSPSKPASPPREKTPMDFWWEDYEASDGEDRLRMTREKLQTVQPDDPWYEAVFPEAIDELQGKLSREQYVSFLEEVERTRPDVFALSAQWYVRDMAFEYLASDKLDDLDAAVGRLAKSMKKMDDPLFSLLSLVRLAGRDKAAENLTDTAMALREESELMHGAVEELIDWAMFAVYQKCAQAGATDEAIEAVHQYCIDADLNDSKEARDYRHRVVLHLAGKSGKTWTRDELLTGNKQEASRRMYLLLTDFQRWLCESRGVVPLVADELRRILSDAIFRMEGRSSDVMRGLTRKVFEPALARYLGFMSLDQFHAPAAVVAMRYFYSFLAANDLVDDPAYKNSIAVCDELWTTLQQSMKADWRSCRFLEVHWPETTV